MIQSPVIAGQLRSFGTYANLIVGSAGWPGAWLCLWLQVADDVVVVDRNVHVSCTTERRLTSDVVLA